MNPEDDDERVEVEERPCPECGGMLPVIKLEFRFAGHDLKTQRERVEYGLASAMSGGSRL